MENGATQDKPFLIATTIPDPDDGFVVCFRCNHCYFASRDAKEAKAHSKLHQFHRCTRCDFVATDRAEFLQHKNRVHSFRCHKCPEVFEFQHLLWKHKQVYHPSSTLVEYKLVSIQNLDELEMITPATIRNSFIQQPHSILKDSSTKFDMVAFLPPTQTIRPDIRRVCHPASKAVHIGMLHRSYMYEESINIDTDHVDNLSGPRIAKAVESPAVFVNRADSVSAKIPAYSNRYVEPTTPKVNIIPARSRVIVLKTVCNTALTKALVVPRVPSAVVSHSLNTTLYDARCITGANMLTAIPIHQIRLVGNAVREPSVQTVTASGMFASWYFCMS